MESYFQIHRFTGGAATYSDRGKADVSCCLKYLHSHVAVRCNCCETDNRYHTLSNWEGVPLVVEGRGGG